MLDWRHEAHLANQTLFYLLAGAASGMLGVYWLKSQADIDLFPEFFPQQVLSLSVC